MTTPRDDASDQMDVAKYAAILLGRWRLVLGVTLLAIVSGLLATFVLAQTEPRYRASANLILTGPRYRLTLDPKFTTVDSLQTVALTTRSEEYRAIALSADVRRMVANTLHDRALDADLAWLNPDIQVKGTLITVAITADTPERAARVVDLYASAVAARLDNVYGQVEQDRESLERNLQDAIIADQRAEEQLGAFTRANRIDEFTFAIERKQTITKNLMAVSVSTIKNRINGLSDALVEVQTLSRSGEALRRQVQDADPARPSLVSASLSLMRLQQQLVSLGTTGTGDVQIGQNGLNVPPTRSDGQLNQAAGQSSAQPSSLAPTSAVGTQSDFSVQIQLGADALLGTEPSRDQLLGDIEAFIANAAGRRQEFQQMADALYQQLAMGTGEDVPPDLAQVDRWINQSVDRLNGEINALQAELRHETSRRDTLSQNLTLAKTVRTTLESKAKEAEITATAGGRVVVASGAESSPPPNWPPPLSRTIPLAGMAGLLIGIVAAFVTERISKRQPATTTFAESLAPEPAVS